MDTLRKHLREIARKRWERTNAEGRTAHAVKMNTARWNTAREKGHENTEGKRVNDESKISGDEF